MNEKWIWLDMDGTFADLYSVKNWLEDLQAYNTRPYRKAKSMYNDIDLMAILACLKGEGYKIGVISWGSKTSDEKYLKAVAETKKEWLANRGYDLVIDKVIVTAYGIKKADMCRKYGRGILVDDEERNRKEWDLGETINAQFDILSQLEALMKRPRAARALADF